MKLLFWPTTFQADVQALAYYLAAQPAVEVTVAMPGAAAYAREPIHRLLPFRGRLLDRDDSATCREVGHYKADITIIDNHVPHPVPSTRLLVLWHGFGWRVDDLSQMRRDLKKRTTAGLGILRLADTEWALR
jgi:hypothetical protein